MNKNSKRINSILAIDYGSRYVGLAIANSGVRIAKTLATLVDLDEVELLKQLSLIIRSEQVDLILVGDPLSLSGDKSQQSKKSELFKLSLSAQLNNQIPIILQAETDSSNWAKEQLGRNPNAKQQGKLDSLAAARILQDYLDEYGFRVPE